MATRERCGAPASSRAAKETSERGEEGALEGGEWTGAVARRLQASRGGAGRAPGRLVAWRPPRWLGGIPPSSLGARCGEEDAPAPGGPGGLAGPAPPGRQVSFLFIFCLIFPFFFYNLFWL